MRPGASVGLRGNQLCIAIMARCRGRGVTAAILAAALGRDADTVLHWATALERVGVLRIVRWVPAPAGKGPRAAAYMLGAGESAKPLAERAARRCRMANAAAIGVLWDLLTDGPTSVTTACDATGFAPGTTRRLLADMRAAGLVRLARWDRRSGCGGTPTPLYEAGSGPDAPMPKPLPAKVHSRAWYWRQRGADSRRSVRLLEA